MPEAACRVLLGRCDLTGVHLPHGGGTPNFRFVTPNFRSRCANLGPVIDAKAAKKLAKERVKAEKAALKKGTSSPSPPPGGGGGGGGGTGGPGGKGAQWKVCRWDTP